MTTVYILDDCEAMLEVFHEILTGLKYKVQCFSSHCDLLKALKEKTSDLVIVDMNLGAGVNGISVLKDIQSSNPKQRVALMSGNPDKLCEVKVKELGGITYINKGLFCSGIKPVISRCLDSDTFFSSL